jgi:DNA invertase Pin-like site-specific DNA recombinase
MGKSAWKGESTDDTGALAGSLNLCRSGTIASGSYLIIEHLDRLSSQKARKALTLFFEILDAGVTVVTLEPEREYTPDIDRDPFSLIKVLLHFVGANEKSETLSKRLRQAWEKKRQERKPLTTWCPAWLKLEGERYVLVPEKAAVVKQIVRLALDGYGDLRLVRKLNTDGVPPISAHHCWTNAFVSKMLRSPALIGHYEPGMERGGKRVLTGEVWNDYFPPVITEEEWYRLRA